MGGIKARIWVKHERGADILCTTDPNAINQLFGGTSILEKGHVLPGDEDGDYEIVDVRTHSYPEIQENSSEYGFSMYNVGERYPYNFDITYIVRRHIRK